MQRNIIVAADCFEGRVRPVTFELIRFARAIAKGTGQVVKVVLTGEEGGLSAYEIAEKEGFDVLVIRTAGAGPSTVERRLFALEQVLPGLNPSFVVFGHTPAGLDMAPALAVGLGACCITGVNGVAQGIRLCFQDPSVTESSMPRWRQIRHAS